MSTLATDDFNRADADPIGGSWTTASSNSAMKIVSNACQPSSLPADCGAYYNAISWPDDQYSQCKITVNDTASGSGPGVYVRLASGAFTCYRAVASHATTNNVELAKFVAGAHTAIWQRTQSFTDGDTLRLEVQGTTLRVFINGVQVGADATDSSVTTGNAGVAYSSQSVSASLDDWEGGDLVTVPPGAPPPVLPPWLFYPIVEAAMSWWQQPTPSSPDPFFPYTTRPARRPPYRPTQPRRPVPPVQESPPAVRTPRLRIPPRLRTPEPVFVPSVQDAPPRIRRIVVRPTLRVRRRTTDVPPAQVVLIAPDWTPQALRQRLRAARLSRRRIVTPVPAQVVLTAPAWVPPSWRGRLRAARLGQRHLTPAPEQTVAPPVRPRRQLKARLARGRAITPTPAQFAPPFVQRRRIITPMRLPRRTRQFVPAQIILLAPAYVPQRRPSRQLRAWLRRRTASSGWLVTTVGVGKLPPVVSATQGTALVSQTAGPDVSQSDTTTIVTQSGVVIVTQTRGGVQ